jgi:hypothetical protein
LLLPALFVGFARNMELHAAWWRTINPFNSEHTMEEGTGWHSLSAMIPALFQKHAAGILLCARLFFVGMTLFFLRRRPFSKPINKLWQLREIAYICLITPLIFPHQRLYDFYYLFPALVAISYFITEAAGKQAKYFSIVLSLFAVFIIFAGRDIVGNRIFESLYAYHATTFAVLIFAGILAWFRPSGHALIEPSIATKI